MSVVSTVAIRTKSNKSLVVERVRALGSEKTGGGNQQNVS